MTSWVKQGLIFQISVKWALNLPNLTVPLNEKLEVCFYWIHWVNVCCSNGIKNLLYLYVRSSALLHVSDSWHGPMIPSLLYHSLRVGPTWYDCCGFITMISTWRETLSLTRREETGWLVKKLSHFWPSKFEPKLTFSTSNCWMLNFYYPSKLFKQESNWQ